MLGEVRLGLLLSDFGDDFNGGGSVPVFRLDDEALRAFPVMPRKLSNLGCAIASSC
jgi:hypothetical protein